MLPALLLVAGPGANAVEVLPIMVTGESPPPSPSATSTAYAQKRLTVIADYITTLFLSLTYLYTKRIYWKLLLPGGEVYVIDFKSLVTPL